MYHFWCARPQKPKSIAPAFGLSSVLAGRGSLFVGAATGFGLAWGLRAPWLTVLDTAALEVAPLDTAALESTALESAAFESAALETAALDTTAPEAAGSTGVTRRAAALALPVTESSVLGAPKGLSATWGSALVTPLWFEGCASTLSASPSNAPPNHATPAPAAPAKMAAKSHEEPRRGDALLVRVTPSPKVLAAE
jgi:hypothetical protein